MKSNFSWKILAILFALLANNAGISLAQNNKNVTIFNYSNKDILALQATNAGNTKWGRDHLGEGVILRSGYNVRINFDDGSGACIFDFRFIFSRTDDQKLFKVNVCQVNAIDVYDTYSQAR